jgi:hypothetical protein
MVKLKVYLATPYGWGKNKGLTAKFIHWWRYRKVTKIAAWWMKKYNVFSPITHTHPMSKYAKLSHAEWLERDFDWIELCDELWVFCQPGWQSSDGVRQEVEFARSKGLAIKFLKRGGKEFHNYSPNAWF